MSAEENKTLVRRIFEEGMSGNQPDVFDQTIAPDYVNYDFPAPAPGREGFKMVAALFTAAFPDLHVTIEDQIAEGDKVVNRSSFTGTHQGEFMGIPPPAGPSRSATSISGASRTGRARRIGSRWICSA